METQCLYYAEMKFKIDSEVERKTREKEQKGNKEKHTGEWKRFS